MRYKYYKALHSNTSIEISDDIIIGAHHKDFMIPFNLSSKKVIKDNDLMMETKGSGDYIVDKTGKGSYIAAGELCGQIVEAFFSIDKKIFSINKSSFENALISLPHSIGNESISKFDFRIEEDLCDKLMEISKYINTYSKEILGKNGK